MQAVSPRKDLYEAVQTVGRAVSGRSTLPILGHILIAPQGETLKLTATDLEMWMECALPARIQTALGEESETAGFTAPAGVTETSAAGAAGTGAATVEVAPAGPGPPAATTGEPATSSTSRATPVAIRRRAPPVAVTIAHPTSAYCPPSWTWSTVVSRRAPGP